MTLHYQVPVSRIKGHYVMPPRDVARMEQYVTRWCKTIRPRGYERYSFPQVGLWSDMCREKQFLGFDPAEVFKITPDCFLAPTGEMVMYPLLFQDPRRRTMRYHQVGPVFRQQSDACSYLMRHREIRYFYELHAMFPDRAALQSEFEYLRKKAMSFFADIGLVVRVHQRPQGDRFPGASRTLAFDTVLRDGRALQIMTLHDLDDRFSKNMSTTPCYQLCLGFTQRLLGAMKDHYGDDLREVDNPYDTITISPRQLQGKTIKVVAENHESFYRNKYTRYKGVVRHCATGAVVDASGLKNHRKGRRDAVRDRVMTQVEAIANKYLVPLKLKHCLGVNPDKTQIYVARKS